MSEPIILLILFVIFNVAAFFVMLLDKVRARKNESKRISEGLLFFMGTAFGALGVYVGMLAFRHKTQKWYFQIGIPLLAIQNIAFGYLIHDLLFK